ncbi:hypothetical protein [Bradyrhizobium arachidis]|uniref:Uncharacterized protein n=1 Tax=Bradyrhizobium arachidis TaxID=858423 RepID=A0AAE7NSZ7_9BRAD|nr:hypothetical protein [Bradyrhizobium arachidis]QOZ70776.1 hypothetical protein WN72_34125 [Bradyrhizobium arachidis]
MAVMTDRETEISADVKGWFAGCAAATAVLFLYGLVAALAKGLTFPLLFAGLFVAAVHFAFIAMFTAVPAGLLMWGVRKARLELVAPLFVACGAALGWSGNYLFSPFDRDRMLYAAAGAAAGLAAWYCSRRSLAKTTERAASEGGTT